LKAARRRSIHRIKKDAHEQKGLSLLIGNHKQERTIDKHYKLFFAKAVNFFDDTSVCRINNGAIE
jgi:hypothetical protein